MRTIDFRIHIAKYLLILCYLLLAGIWNAYPQSADQAIHSEHSIQTIDTNRINLDSLQNSIKSIHSAIAQKLRSYRIPSSWLDSLANSPNLNSAFFDKLNNLKASLQDTELLNLINELENNVRLKILKMDKLTGLKVRGQKISGDLHELTKIAELNITPDDEKLASIEKVPAEIIKSGSGRIESIDNLIDKKAAELEEIQALKEFDEIINELKETGRKVPSSFSQRMAIQKSFLAETEIGPEQAEKLQSAMDKMLEYKKKYYAITNSEDVEMGIEKPIKGKPVGRHWIFGSNFQANPAPISMDISPLIGYRINYFWSVGIGGSMRYGLDPKENFRPPNAKNIVFGYRAFNQYRAIKKTFIHGELEAFSQPVTGKRFWKVQALAGIGKELKVAKGIKAQVILLYNFSHNEKSPYAQPLVARFGFIRDKAD